MTPRLPSVRHRGSETRSFIPEDPVKATSTTETPLPEHNGSEKPGRWDAPKGTALVPLASQAGHLAFAHSASGGCAPADVLGRRFDTSTTNQMDTTHHGEAATDDQQPRRTAGRSRLCIAHTYPAQRGRKSTPFVPRLNLRVGIENHRTAWGVPTLPTLPRGVSERGRKSTPPFGNARAHWQRPRVGTVGGGAANE